MHKYLHIHLTFHNFTPINFLTHYISYIISLLSHSYFGNEMVYTLFFMNFSSSKNLQYISYNDDIYVGQFATRCSRSPIPVAFDPNQMVDDNKRRVRIDCYDDPLCPMNGINSPKGVNDSEYNNWSQQQEVRLSKYDPRSAEYDTWSPFLCT